MPTSTWSPGLDLSELQRGPIDRKTLALFAGGSHDHVAFHIDSDAARKAGFDDVIAHGMLSMAYLAQALTRWAPQDNLVSWRVRFSAMTPLHASVCCRGRVVEICEHGHERIARVEIGAWIDGEFQTLAGEALIRL